MAQKQDNYFDQFETDDNYFGQFEEEKVDSAPPLVSSHEPPPEKEGLLTSLFKNTALLEANKQQSPEEYSNKLNRRPDTSMFNATELGSRFGEGILPSIGRFGLEVISDPTVFGGGSLIKRGVEKGISRFTGKKAVESIPSKPIEWVLQADGKSLFNKVTGEVHDLSGAMSSHSSIDEVADEVIGDLIPEPTVSPKFNSSRFSQSARLPRDLAGAKPRFNMGSSSYLPQFESDIDRALFIIAQKTPSKRNADYLKFVMDNTGMTANEAMDAAVNFRTSLKDIMRSSEPGDVVVPKSKFSEFISSEEGSMALPSQETIKKHAMKTANTMKTMSSSLDLSAPLRQGIGLMHRGEYYTAAKNMGRYLADESFFNDAMAKIHNRPLSKLGEDSGLFISDHIAPTRMEEHFADSYINTLRESGSRFGRIVTEPYAASERAYVGFLNELRANTFDSLVRKAQKSGVPMFEQALDKAGKPILDKVTGNVKMVPNQLAKNIAKYVNTASGRGDLGRLNKYGEELNTLFFSPRFIASRMQTLDPRFYIKADPFLRKEALKTWMGITGMIGTMNGIAAVTGNEYNLTEPTSSDFGKGKFGNTRFDTGAGHLQYITAMSRFLNRLNETHVNGNPPTYGQQTALGGLMGVGGQQPSFMENKFSPMAGLVDSILTGRRNFDGTKINIPTEIVKRFTPMFMQDMAELIQSEPDLLEPGAMVKIGAAAGLGSLGVSVQTYESSNRNRSSNRRQLVRSH